ncbi:MAG: PIN domain-containing protein [Candidatus Kapabacteria bacterium]|nr:PIN domain-containing protein [Candidatus Kapabacteria bacterium]
MSKKLLLDTCFFIDLYSHNIEVREKADSYLNYFKEQKYKIITSSIVVSEFWNSARDLKPFENVPVFPFSQIDGITSSHINEKFAEIRGVDYDKKSKNCVSNDYMILSQCFNNQFTLVTKDSKLKKDIDLLELKTEIVIPCIAYNDSLDLFIGKENGMEPIF